MINPFQPTIPFISPSLNQARVMALPGQQLPVAVQGKTGFELLSAAALTARIQSKAEQIGLDPDQPDLIPAFAGCLTAVSDSVRQTAVEIVKDYGRALGYVLLTLKRGDAANRAVRPQWDERHWAWWSQINTIGLGGGLASEPLGSIMANTAQNLMQKAGFPDFAVHVSPYGGNIALAGAARLTSQDATEALVFDFGHSQVKRAVAQLNDGRLTQLIPLPALPTPCEPYEYKPWSLEATPQVAEEMVTAVAQTWSEMQAQNHTLSSTIVFSLACYLVNNHPIPAHLRTGCYARLQALANNLERFLSDQVSAALATPIHVKVVHDATAAALAYTGWQNTAVITLGTSLGIGFPLAD